ncbi:MAG: glycosyltransferase family 4 protein [Actinobacteria bacterium]|nr:glycosyltransferase family 4 protein [Actinomycetota bacterium]
MLTFCTIICRNYLAQARVLADSLQKHYPESAFHVLVADAPNRPGVSYANEPFLHVDLQDLAIPELDVMKGIYSPVEFLTAVKPWLLDWVLQAHPGDSVVYLDPDIQVFSRMTELEDMLERNWALLTPHMTDALPVDGHTPTEQALLLAGIYNLGFIGLSPSEECSQFLEWWQERLRRDCVVAPPKGFFVDQRYVDFVPGLWDNVGILRHPGYNVAYWNLATRHFDAFGDQPKVNGADLRFVHFSGFDPRRPSELSSHQDRIDLSVRTDVATFTDAYAAALHCHDYESLAQDPYPFGRAASGRSIGKLARHLYRAQVESGFEGSLFEESGEARFAESVQAKDSRLEYLTIAQAFYWTFHTDIQHNFPDTSKLGSARFLHWLKVDSRVASEFGDVVTVMPELGDGAEAPSLDGVNIVGYLTAAMGVGEIARRLVGACDAVDLPVAPSAVHTPQIPDVVSFAHLQLRHGFPYAHTVACVNADMFQGLALSLENFGFRDSYVSAVWWWEVDSFPESLHAAFAHVDQVLVGSAFIEEALRDVSPVPVKRIPIPVQISPRAALLSSDLPTSFDWPDGFTFYFSFDFNSVWQRKNPLAVVAAFTTAFALESGAHLVIKTLNDEQHPQLVALLNAAIADRADISVLSARVSEDVRDRLVWACDCYVSLHRSEGLGLTMAEAMYAGKPVIATGYSGNMDFMTPENSLLIPYELVAVGSGAGPYPPDARWAEPDLNAAADAMRAVFEDAEFARRIGEAAAKSIRKTNSSHAAGEALMAALS